MKRFIQPTLPPKSDILDLASHSNHIVPQPFHGGRKVSPTLIKSDPKSWINRPILANFNPLKPKGALASIEKTNGTSPITKTKAAVIQSRQNTDTKIKQSRLVFKSKALKYAIYGFVVVVTFLGLRAIFKGSRTTKLA